MNVTMNNAYFDQDWKVFIIKLQNKYISNGPHIAFQSNNYINAKLLKNYT